MFLRVPIRRWQLLVTLLAIVAILLLPHLPNHSAATFLLIPIFLFVALIDEQCTYEPRNDHVFALNHHVRTALFQRPPPQQA